MFRATVFLSAVIFAAFVTLKLARAAEEPYLRVIRSSISRSRRMVRGGVTGTETVPNLVPTPPRRRVF